MQSRIGKLDCNVESFQLRAILGFPVMSTCNLSLNSFCMYCSSQQVPGTGDLICIQHRELLTGGMIHLLVWELHRHEYVGKPTN
jgi:hypothetical protein